MRVNTGYINSIRGKTFGEAIPSSNGQRPREPELGPSPLSWSAGQQQTAVFRLRTGHCRLVQHLCRQARTGICWRLHVRARQQAPQSPEQVLIMWGIMSSDVRPTWWGQRPTRALLCSSAPFLREARLTQPWIVRKEGLHFSSFFTFFAKGT